MSGIGPRLRELLFPALLVGIAANISIAAWRAHAPDSAIKNPNLSADPKVGSKPFLSPIETKNTSGSILICLGGCSCNPEILRPALAELKGYNVVVIARTSDLKFTALRGLETTSVRLVHDAQGRIQASLNAVFLPRVYAVDGGGRLTYVQKVISGNVLAEVGRAKQKT